MWGKLSFWKKVTAAATALTAVVGVIAAAIPVVKEVYHDLTDKPVVVQAQTREEPTVPQTVAEAAKRDSERKKGPAAAELTFAERYPQSFPVHVQAFTEQKNPPSGSTGTNKDRTKNWWDIAYAIDYIIEGDGEGTKHTIWISCSEKPSSARVAELCDPHKSSPAYRKKHHLTRKW